MKLTRKRDRARIARRMTELRAEHNVTQQQCADALGIMQHSYSALEKGRTRVRRRDLVTLAVLYGLTLAEAFPEFAESEVAA